jgi:hypothetical protein
MSRLATAADIPAIVTLWNAARPIMEATMPPFEPVSIWTPEAVLGHMAAGHIFYFEPPDKGFVMMQSNPVPWGPSAKTAATELNIGVLKPGMTRAQKLAVLRPLFVMAFNANKGKLVWFALPETEDADALALADTVVVGAWGFMRTDRQPADYPGQRDLGSWRLYTLTVPSGGVK